MYGREMKLHSRITETPKQGVTSVTVPYERKIRSNDLKPN